MKKTLNICISVVVVCLTLYYFKENSGWKDIRQVTDTPKQFWNKTSINKNEYIKDSLLLLAKLRDLLLRHGNGDFFYSKEYFEGTDIIIDTIVYSPDFTKMGILVITKNPTSRQLMPIKDNDYYYNATAYLCVKFQDTLNLTWVGPSFTNSKDKSEISKDIREACFRIFASKNTTDIPYYKYNLNDSRFWTSSVWQKIEEDRVKRNEFEKEKINHPENIYEPLKR